MGSMGEVNNQIFGDSAIFRPTDGISVSCLIDIEHDVELQPDSYGATVVEFGSTIEALVSEVGEPQRGDVFEVGAVDYTVAKIMENDGQFVKVVVA